jgi:hypothetical protein
MSEPGSRAQMAAVLSTEAGLVKVVRELGRCVGLLAVTAHGLSDDDRKLIIQSTEELETLLARVGEFLPEPPPL